MPKGPGKGVSNNPAGKPKGTQNGTTKSLKEFYVSLLEDNRDKMKEALKKLSEKDSFQYLQAMDKISQKVVANKRDITSDDKPIQTLPITGVKIIKDGTREQPTTKTG